MYSYIHIYVYIYVKNYASTVDFAALRTVAVRPEKCGL